MMSNLKFHLFILAKPQVMYLLVEQVVSPEISEQAFFFFFCPVKTPCKEIATDIWSILYCLFLYCLLIMKIQFYTINLFLMGTFQLYF